VATGAAAATGLVVTGAAETLVGAATVVVTGVAAVLGPATYPVETGAAAVLTAVGPATYAV